MHRSSRREYTKTHYEEYELKSPVKNPSGQKGSFFERPKSSSPLKKFGAIWDKVTNKVEVSWDKVVNKAEKTIVSAARGKSAKKYNIKEERKGFEMTKIN